MIPFFSGWSIKLFYLYELAFPRHVLNSRPMNNGSLLLYFPKFLPIKGGATAHEYLVACYLEYVPSNGRCAQRRLKSNCVSTQSFQSLHCPHEETLHPWLSKMPIEDSDRTARMRRPIWIFDGRTYPKVPFIWKVIFILFWCTESYIHRRNGSINPFKSWTSVSKPERNCFLRTPK